MLFYKDMDKILKKIIFIISEHFSIEKDQIDLDGDFEKVFGADSIDIVELLLATEKEFLIDISAEEARTLRTPRDAINFIESRSQTDQ